MEDIHQKIMYSVHVDTLYEWNTQMKKFENYK